MEDNIAIRNYGNFHNRSIWLNNKFNWELKIDSEKQFCLIPTVK